LGRKIPRKPRAPPLQTASSKPLTSAERNAKWRLARDKTGDHISAPLVTCIPRGNIELDQLEAAGTATMALYDELVRNVNRWLDRLDAEPLSTADGLLAFRLLPQVLESLAVLRAKISEQRGAEARNVTSEMQTNLEASGKREAPKIEQTLELLRSRFNDIKKPKAN
jgi:hypothetical protein